MPMLIGGLQWKGKPMVQKVQNFAKSKILLNQAKSIGGKLKYDSASAALKKSKLLNLKTRLQIHETVFVHKEIIGKKKPKTFVKFSTNTN